MEKKNGYARLVRARMVTGAKTEYEIMEYPSRRAAVKALRLMYRVCAGSVWYAPAAGGRTVYTSESGFTAERVLLTVEGEIKSMEALMFYID